LLQRIQGSQRQWIEKYRLGDCSHGIVDLSLIEITPAAAVVSGLR